MEFASQKTPRLFYKDQPFNAVYGDTAVYFMVKCRDGNVKVVVYVVTTALQRVKVTKSLCFTLLLC
jgi:hypothetical protein